MGWISWTLVVSTLFQLVILLIRSDKLRTDYLDSYVPHASELTGQVSILLLTIIPLGFSLYKDISSNRKQVALEKLKRTTPLVNAWLDTRYGGYVIVAIECKNSVPINFKWGIATMTKDNQKASLRVHVSSGKEFEIFYPSSNTKEKNMYIDFRTSKFPLSYAVSLADTYNVVMIVDYKSIYFEEMDYKSELEGQIVRKYELVDYTLKEVQ